MNEKDLSLQYNQKTEEVLYPPQGWDKAEMMDVPLAELIRSNKELEQFAFTAAHDLLEPLIVVSSYAHILDRQCRGKLSDKTDATLSLILEGTERMQELIQSLLSYSRAGKGNIQLKRLDSNVALNRAVENLKITIEKHSAQISCEDCPVIVGDEIQLMQVFQNLINNAIKFHKKDEAPCVRVSAEEKSDHWFFSVRDNGIGIDPQNAGSIFELFKRLHAQSEYAGNGIGLALCKRIIESHRGKIWIESEAGKGTAVYFTIPKA